ncbi:uncharacterized protein STEHIDRAFT_116761 [Stereum hirsutum FP-91666 SS1]|uniref:Uncharacterized protein n=1 Tax=Stereum hirsutum (strain FP-91666) TaxID=721885 RepID=R7RWJ5_STEHR|nr:uncharacterized protein STEHIDRAFT_116761 [Stereum hirsutum FP-91666 SS1]EIM79133.1 hypothetical protein STEHIDRAFT_116761 [Stereum hirsutum FP-91666 SS1]
MSVYLSVKTNVIWSAMEVYRSSRHQVLRSATVALREATWTGKAFRASSSTSTKRRRLTLTESQPSDPDLGGRIEQQRNKMGNGVPPFARRMQSSLIEAGVFDTSWFPQHIGSMEGAAAWPVRQRKWVYGTPGGYRHEGPASIIRAGTELRDKQNAQKRWGEQEKSYERNRTAM